jgi:N utilization substance protein A
LFELEVPEIEDGIVEIKSIAREAGSRTKIAVWTDDENVDPVGACVGARGSRVQNVVDALSNEKIDIINWSDDPVTLISNVLSPAKVEEVFIEDNERMATVVVPDYQLSLAIGKSGQNVRLAAKLCGWKIDIKSHTQYYGDVEDEEELDEMTPETEVAEEVEALEEAATVEEVEAEEVIGEESAVESEEEVETETEEKVETETEEKVEAEDVALEAPAAEVEADENLKPAKKKRKTTLDEK